MSKVACEHGDIDAFFSTGINGIRVKCRYCGEELWERKDITVEAFREIETLVFVRLGYSSDGKKLKFVKERKEYVKPSKLRNVKIEKVMSPAALRQLEHDPRIQTTITDREMMLFYIDMALDNRDEVVFRALVRELEEMK